MEGGPNEARCWKPPIESLQRGQQGFLWELLNGVKIQLARKQTKYPLFSMQLRDGGMRVMKKEPLR